MFFPSIKLAFEIQYILSRKRENTMERVKKMMEYNTKYPKEASPRRRTKKENERGGGTG